MEPLNFAPMVPVLRAPKVAVVAPVTVMSPLFAPAPTVTVREIPSSQIAQLEPLLVNMTVCHAPSTSNVLVAVVNPNVGVPLPAACLVHVISSSVNVPVTPFPTNSAQLLFAVPSPYAQITCPVSVVVAMRNNSVHRDPDARLNCAGRGKSTYVVPAESNVEATPSVLPANPTPPIGVPLALPTASTMPRCDMFHRLRMFCVSGLFQSTPALYDGC